MKRRLKDRTPRQTAAPQASPLRGSPGPDAGAAMARAAVARDVAEARESAGAGGGGKADYRVSSHEAVESPEEAMSAYAPIVADMKARYDLKVKRWRRAMSGCAWRVHYHDGRTVNWIESPFPRSPISLAVFLHEVGHHVIGFDRYRLRCEEEYYAWVWAIDQMRGLGVEPDEKVSRRFELSMQYAVDKALRRGLKKLPDPLARFVPAAA